MNKVRRISAGLAVVVLTAGIAFAHENFRDAERSGPGHPGQGGHAMQGAKAQPAGSGRGGAMEGCMGGSDRRDAMKGEGMMGGMMRGGMMSGMMGGGMMGGAAPNSQWRGNAAP